MKTLQKSAWLLLVALVATLGRQAESLEKLVADVRLVASLVDRVYLGMLVHVALREIGDRDARVKEAERLHDRWRQAAHRLWMDGGPVLVSPEDANPKVSKGG